MVMRGGMEGLGGSGIRTKGSAQPGSFQAGFEFHCGSSTGSVVLRDGMIFGLCERAQKRFRGGQVQVVCASLCMRVLLRHKNGNGLEVGGGKEETVMADRLNAHQG